jgi:solute carrier family 6 amino acid transporter-like protein 5/7/9/14
MALEPEAEPMVAACTAPRLVRNPGRVVREAGPRLEQAPILRMNSVSVDSPAMVPPGEEVERIEWTNPMEFLLSCVSMAVGLGNVWRFPFTAYENGGGAFLIPYFIVLLLIGRPLYFMELALGQFASSGCVGVWAMAPGFAGVGLGHIFISLCVMSTYTVLIVYSLHYLYASLEPGLPWTDGSAQLTDCRTKTNSSAERYFYCGVLRTGRSDYSHVEGLGLPDRDLALCLAAAWLLLYCTIRRGVRSSGKMAYITATVPYIVLVCLLIRGLSLPGAGYGLQYLFTPQWEALLRPTVWKNAVVQVFFSLAICMGTLTTYSSFNRFSHNIYRDAAIISVVDTATSLLASAVVFSVLGHLAYERALAEKKDSEVRYEDIDIKAVANGGFTLVFQTYPELLAKFPVPNLFSAVFFLMFTTLGVGSCCSNILAVQTAIHDKFPTLSRERLAGWLCTGGFLTGLLFVTPGGPKLNDLVTEFSYSIPVILFGLGQVIVVSFVYGVDNFLRDVNFMLGREAGGGLGLYWRLCWGLTCPAGLVLLLATSLLDSPYLRQPSALLPLGLALLTLACLLVPAVLARTLWQAEGSLGERWAAASRPSPAWGPACTASRARWRDHTAGARQPRGKVLMDFTSSDKRNEV